MADTGRLGTEHSQLGLLELGALGGDDSGALLEGEGSVSGSGVVTRTGSANLSGLGQVVASWAQQDIEGAADLDAVGSLVSRGFVGSVATAELDGTGSLSAGFLLTSVGSAQLAGTGAIGSFGSPVLSSSAQLIGSGLLQSGAQTGTFASAVLTGVGSSDVSYIRIPRERQEWLIHLGTEWLVHLGTQWLVHIGTEWPLPVNALEITALLNNTNLIAAFGGPVHVPHVSTSGWAVHTAPEWSIQ